MRRLACSGPDREHTTFSSPAGLATASGTAGTPPLFCLFTKDWGSMQTFIAQALQLPITVGDFKSKDGKFSDEDSVEECAAAMQQVQALSDSFGNPISLVQQLAAFILALKPATDTMTDYTSHSSKFYQDVVAAVGQDAKDVTIFQSEADSACKLWRDLTISAVTTSAGTPVRGRRAGAGATLRAGAPARACCATSAMRPPSRHSAGGADIKPTRERSRLPSCASRDALHGFAHRRPPAREPAAARPHSKFARGHPMKKLLLAAAAVAATSGAALAAEGPVPQGIAHLDHVFVVMMENHGYSQIINNPNAPFINKLAHSANLATNYFAVGHPSLTNYLEVVGGSNFGVQSDNSPDWHNAACTPNIVAGTDATDNPPSPAICPIAGMGTDAMTPAVDTTNEASGLPGENNIDGIQWVPAAANTLGKTIADQLVAAGKSWKSYQESLPPVGADGINVSDGFYTNKTDFSQITPVLNPPLTSSDIVALYAVKHNPFAYFKSAQDAVDPRMSLVHNTVDFGGPRGLYADLARGSVPTFSFIAPNQCNDQHGRGNGGAFCNYDPSSDGTQAGLNPALIQRGDMTVQRVVRAIKASPAWHEGRNAIVVLWDENDYSTAPNVNQVVTIVDTNYGRHGVKSAQRYTHFSLLRSLEGALGLPCLNHACDSGAGLMSDLFGAR